MKKTIKRFWWILAIVGGIIAIFAFSIIGSRPAFLGTWVYSSGKILTIDENTWTEGDENEKNAYTYDANTDTVTVIDNGSTEQFKVDTSTKDELRLTSFNYSSTKTLYRKGTKLANGAIAASSSSEAAYIAAIELEGEKQAQILEKENKAEEKLLKAFTADDRHIVELTFNHYYYTTWTKQQIIDENKKISSQVHKISQEADDQWGWFSDNPDISKVLDYQKARENELSSTYGTNTTFTNTSVEGLKLEDVWRDYSGEPEGWYENALAAKEADVITTEEELSKIVK